MTDSISAPRTQVSLGWMLACLFLCVALIAFGAHLVGWHDQGWAYQLGAIAPLALILGGGLHLAFRKEPAGAKWMGIAAVYAALALSSGLDRHRQDKESAQRKPAEAAELAKVRNVLDQVEHSIKTQTPVSDAASATSTAQGQAGSVTVLRWSADRALVLRRDYEKAVDALELAQVMSPNHLAGKGGLDLARTRLSQAREVAKDYEKRNRALLVEIRETIKTAPMQEDERRGMLKGFDDNQAQRIAQLEQNWGSEHKALALMTEMVDLLQQRRAHWAFQNEQLMFSQQADLDRYRSLGKQLQQVSADQQALQQREIERVRKKLDDIGSR